jgi:hypothetical protein
MKRKIVFDIDGVIRNLGIIHKRFNIPKLSDNWHWTYKGKDVYGWVKEDYKVLEEAPPLEYAEAIRDYGKTHKLEFWTHQPDEWKPYTKRWMKHYFGKGIKIRFLEPRSKFDLLQKHKNIMLVDDYPLFPNYKQIILADQYYNQKVNCLLRVKSKEELAKLLEKY